MTVLMMKVGIVGLPNVGKTTIFNTLTHAHAACECYPFCTIEPNIGSVSVPDRRLQRLVELFKPEKIIPAQVQFLDVAGLVEGASHGEGLGNQFLGHIRETQAIAQVVRCFQGNDVAYQGSTIDPVKELEIVATELLLADLQVVEKAIKKRGREKRQAELLESFHKAIAKGTPLRRLELTTEDLSLVNEFQFLTLKPTIVIANVGDGQSETERAWVEEVYRAAEALDAETVKISGKIEQELTELAPADAAVFLKEMNLEEEALPRFIRKCYRLLGLITFFTVESGIVQAWAIPTGSTAPEAAAQIHTDMSEGFIKAEVIAFEDLDRVGSVGEARGEGILKIEGRNYVVEDGDVIRFRFT